MRLALLIMTVALFSGCFGEEEPAPVDQIEYPSPVPPLPAGVVHRPDPRQNVSAQESEVQLLMDLGTSDYSNNLTRVAITANGSATIEVAHEALVPVSDLNDNCAASAVTVIEDGNVSLNEVTLMWMRSQRADVEVQVQGSGAGTPDTSDGGNGGVQSVNFTATVQLKKGDQVIVEMGGVDAGVFHNATHGANLTYVINATGPVHIEPLPTREIRCGAGALQSGGTLHVRGPNAEFAAQTAVTLNVTSAATLQYGNGLAGGAKQVDVQFLDKTYQNPAFIAEAQEGAGDLAIHFKAWGDGLGAGRWFMGDVYWPRIGS